MKRIVAIVAIVIVLIVVAILIAANNKANTSIAILIPYSSIVEVKEQGVDFVSASSQMEILEGTVIRTKDKGGAIVIFSDNSILTIDSNSEVELAKVGTNGNLIEIIQHSGNTWHRVTSGEAVNRYKLTTPSLEVLVKGTNFGVESSMGEDVNNQVLVLEGEVEVTPLLNDSEMAPVSVQKDQIISFTNAQLKESISIRVEQVGAEKLGTVWTSMNILLNGILTQEDINQAFDNPENIKTKLDEFLAEVARRPELQRDNLVDLDKPKPSINRADIESAKQELETLQGKLEDPEVGEAYCIKLFEIGKLEAESVVSEAETVGIDVSNDSQYLNFAFDYCLDGELDEQEVYDLEAYLMGLSPDVRVEFDREIGQYLDLYFHAGLDGNPDCDRINSTSQEEFIEGLKFVEDSFGVIRSTNQEVILDFEAIKRSCEEEE